VTIKETKEIIKRVVRTRSEIIYSNKHFSGGYGACFLAGCRKGTELFKARELNVFDKAMA